MTLIGYIFICVILDAIWLCDTNMLCFFICIMLGITGLLWSSSWYYDKMWLCMQFCKGGCIIFSMWLGDGMSRLGFDNVFVQFNVTFAEDLVSC